MKGYGIAAAVAGFALSACLESPNTERLVERNFIGFLGDARTCSVEYLSNGTPVHITIEIGPEERMKAFCDKFHSGDVIAYPGSNVSKSRIVSCPHKTDHVSY